MKTKKETLNIAIVAILVAFVVTISSFGITINMIQESNKEEEIEVKNFEKNNILGNSITLDSSIPNLNDNDELVVQYLKTQVKDIKVSWKLSTKTIRKGDQFEAYLTIKNTPKKFKLYWEDIGTSGIKILDIYGSKGNYTILCKANKAGKCIIKYIPTGKSIEITVKKKATPVSTTKATWSIPLALIYKGDTFNVTLELKNTSNNFKLYWEDISAYGLNISSIYEYNGKYILECKAEQAGKATIKYIPTGEYVSIDIYEKYVPVEKAYWSNIPNYVYKGDKFTLNLNIQNISSDFKLKWEDIGTWGIKIISIYGGNGRYSLECEATESGNGRMVYLPTNDLVNITINEKIVPVQCAYWDVPIYITRGNYFYAEMTLVNMPNDYKLSSQDIGTYGISIIDIKGEGNKYTITCKADIPGNLVIGFIPTDDSVSIFAN